MDVTAGALAYELLVLLLLLLLVVKRLLLLLLHSASIGVTCVCMRVGAPSCRISHRFRALLLLLPTVITLIFSVDMTH